MNFSIKKIEVSTIILLALLLVCQTNCSFINKYEGLEETKVQKFIKNQQIIQLAELEIDSAQLDVYLDFLTEEVETSLAIEPGVLMLNAMQEEDHPTKVKLVEIYANQTAYKSHIASPHFQKYKKGTANMVKSLKLTRMQSINASAMAKGNSITN